MTAPDPKLIGMYDQHKSEFNERIDKMVAKWRSEHDAGKSDFEIFGAQLAGMDNAQPSFERLAVMVALMVERLGLANAALRLGGAPTVPGVNDGPGERALAEVSDPTTPLDLEAIRERVEAATPGRWITGDQYEPGGMYAHEVVISPNLPPIEMEETHAGLADAAFIAAARSDIPALLAELAEVRAERIKYGEGYNSERAGRERAEAALAEAQRERDELRNARDYFRREHDLIHEFWTDLGNEVLKNAPDTYDADEAADAIAVRYVRDLEAAVGAVRQLAQRWVDEGTEAGAGVLASAVFQATGLPIDAAVDTYETQTGGTE